MNMNTFQECMLWLASAAVFAVIGLYIFYQNHLSWG